MKRRSFLGLLGLTAVTPAAKLLPALPPAPLPAGVTAPKIFTGPITGEMIAHGTISADKIVTGSITALRITGDMLLSEEQMESLWARKVGGDLVTKQIKGLS